MAAQNARAKQFTSIVGILLLAGHKGIKVKLDYSVGNLFRRNTDYVWFPGLQIVIHVNSNTVVQITQNSEEWWYRKNRKNAWCNLGSKHGGDEFVKLIEPHYSKYLSDLMLKET